MKNQYVSAEYKNQYDDIDLIDAERKFTELKAINKSGFIHFEPRYFEMQLASGGQSTALADNALYVATLSRLILKHGSQPRLTLVGDAAHQQAAICYLLEKLTGENEQLRKNTNQTIKSI